MKKDMGKRLGCAALAAQMLITPAVQAVSPLRDSLVSSHMPTVSLAESRLVRGEEKQAFPHLNIGTAPSQITMGQEAPSAVGTDLTLPEKKSLAASVSTDSPELKMTETPESEVSPVPAKGLETKMATTSLPIPETMDLPVAAESPDMDLPPEVTVETAPMATPVPVESMGPEETPFPETTETSAPVETPDVVLPPEITVEPTPTETPVPEESLGPQETPLPDITEAPAPAETPDVVLPPEADVTPGPTETSSVVLPPEARIVRRRIKRQMRQNLPDWFGDDPSAFGYVDEFGDSVGDPDTGFIDIYAFFGFGPNYSAPGDSTDKYNYESPLTDDKTETQWVHKRNEIANANAEFPYSWAEKDSGIQYVQDYYCEPNNQLSVDSSSYEAVLVPGINGYPFEDIPRTLLRLPDREFSGEWYVVGYERNPSGEVQFEAPLLPSGGGDWIDERWRFGEQLNSGAFYESWLDAILTNPRIYQELEYDPQWDGEIPFDPEAPLNQYLDSTASTNNHDYNKILHITDQYGGLPIIAKWVASTDATLTQLAFQYQTEKETTSADIYRLTVGDNNEVNTLKGLTKIELSTRGNTFQDETENYFMRLPASATELLLKELTAYEPSSQVTIQATYGDAKVVDYELDGTASLKNGTNSYENPARSTWTLKDGSIPVQITEGETSQILSKVEIKVTAPDTVSTKTYTVHVQRLQRPYMTLNPGNTPMGMIERNKDNGGDSTKDDATWTDVKKEKSIEVLKNQLSFMDTTSGHPVYYEPRDQYSNNGGNVWKRTYNGEAWIQGGGNVNKDKNVDLDAGAIVVYQNSSFDVPSVEVTNAIGQTADLETKIVDPNGGQGTGAQIDPLSWKLELTLVNELGPDVVFEQGTSSGPQWSGTGNVDNITLIDQKIKPYVYNLSYTYIDPYDGEEHEGGTFVRKVVILPLHGDVDMDGVVTTADGVALQKLIDAGFFNDVQTCDNVAKRLYCYRVCDIDGYGVVNEDDVKALLEGYSPVLTDTENHSSDYFYLPLPGNAPRTATTAQIDETAPSIGLKYLGQGTDAGALTSDPLNCNDGEKTPENSVFWVEAQIDGSSDALKDNLAAVTVTMTYDSAYVAPYLPDGVSNWSSYIMSQNPQWAGWTVREAKGMDIVPVDHPSKALPGLSTLGTDASGESTLREIRFSITAENSFVKLDSLTNGGLVKVPFQLNGIPAGMKNTTTNKLVELVLGPRDLTIVTDSVSAVWDNAPDHRLGTKTQNLMDLLNYRGSDPLPIGEDKTPCQYVYKNGTTENWVYGEVQSTANNYGQATVTTSQSQFKYFPAASNISWEDAPADRPVVSYDSTNRILTVTPTKAGEFNFTFDSDPAGTIYRIVVEKAPLDLTVQDVVKYYGEGTSKTETSTQTFKYNEAQIKGLDLTTGLSNTGSEEDLKALMGDGYIEPKIVLATDIDGKNPVKDITPPTKTGEEHYVLLQGGSSENYKFRYVQTFTKTDASLPTEPDKTTGTAKLTILPRPILVEEVAKYPIGTWLENDTTLRKNGSAEYNNSKQEFTLGDLPGDKVDSNGYYNGKAPLTLSATKSVVGKDTLELDYEAEIKKKAGVDGSVGFNLSQPQEDRDAEIINISLADGKGENQNYVLANDVTKDNLIDVIKPVDTAATASVEKRQMERLVIERLPEKDITSYEYGETLNLIKFLIRAYYKDNGPEIEGSETIASMTRNELGLKVQWVPNDKTIPDATYPDVKDNEELTKEFHDGKYICFTGTGANPPRVYLGPFKIAKKTLTLTIQGETRYYGEEISHWHVGYDRSQLSTWDQAKYPQVTGEIEDIQGLLQDLMIRPMQGNTITSRRVDETTDIGNNYYVLIYGAKSDNYNFEYTCTTDTSTTVSSTLGYAPLKIVPRPILVTSIAGPAGSLYHNSTSYTIASAEAMVGNNAAGYTAQLPAPYVENDPSTVYYTLDSTGQVTTYTAQLPLSKQPIHIDDVLSINYHAEFLDRDRDTVPFYDLGVNEVYREVSVQVTDLALKSGSRSRNYQLVFPNYEAADNGWVGADRNGSKTKGSVHLRRINGIRVVTAPKTDYKYGVDALNLSGMEIEVTYAGDNGAKDDVRLIPYAETTVGTETTNTFKQVGLSLHWGASNGPEAANGQILSVAEHNGKTLYVTGPQYPGETVIADKVTTPVTVEKAVLTLKVENKSRIYGEENGGFRFTFDASELPSWDRNKVSGLILEGTTSADGSVVSAALAAVNASYEDGQSKNELVLPQFSTTAQKKSPVQSGTPYPITLVGGSMANYVFKVESGELTIQKRPIIVTGVNRGTDVNGNQLPIYTVSEGVFSSSMMFDAKDIIYNQDVLTLIPDSGLTGSALVDNDSIAVNMQIRFTGGSPFTPGDTEYEKLVDVTARNIKLVTGGVNDNYELKTSSVAGFVTKGSVYRLTIKSIEIIQNPALEYTYGQPLNLNDMLVKVTYRNETTGEETTANVCPAMMNEFYVNYWEGNAEPNESDWKDRTKWETTVKNQHPAHTNDHLTIAPDTNGFAQNNKYLIVSARTHASQDFVRPVLTSIPIKVNPLELTYTLTADDKIYDGTRAATGSIVLTNVYGNDDVTLKPATFTFVDANVRYQEKDVAQDYYWNELPIEVEVTNIAIDESGKDYLNYNINSEVTTETVHQVTGRDNVPSAKIMPLEREVPDVITKLWVSEHTNTVVVNVTPVDPVGDPKDEKNSELHYEYALIYKSKDGALIRTAYQDSPYFGGEKVEVDAPEFESNGVTTERPVSGGQAVDPADKDFGSRTQLPRGTYFGALVRLSQTNNYKASIGKASFGGVENDNDDDLLAALNAAAAQVEATELPEPENEKMRQEERIPGPVIKTYTYRIDLVSASKEKDTQDKEHLVPMLEEVWFTDVKEFTDAKALDRLINNLDAVRYHGYSWDMQEKENVKFPLRLDEEILIDLPVDPEDEASAKIPTQVCGSGTIRLYVPVTAKGGGSVLSPLGIRIDPEHLELSMGDDPVQLKAVISPAGVTSRTVVWESSDETVVTVSKFGVVTVVGPGTATITARIQFYSISDSIEVVVKQPVQQLPLPLPYADTMFNTGYDKAFMELYNGRFEPERTMTRGELVVVMEKFFQLVDGLEPVPPTQYKDIEAEDECSAAVQTLDMWGIVNGVGEDKFAPDQIATRAEAAAILSRMLMLPLEEDQTAPHAYIDAGPEDTWGWGYIDALAKAKITYGTGDNNYNPGRALTRAEMATFIARVLVTKIDKSVEIIKVPSDVTEDYWAYEFILRAVNGSPAVTLAEEYTTGVYEVTGE